MITQFFSTQLLQTTTRRYQWYQRFCILLIWNISWTDIVSLDNVFILGNQRIMYWPTIQRKTPKGTIHLRTNAEGNLDSSIKLDDLQSWEVGQHFVLYLREGLNWEVHGKCWHCPKWPPRPILSLWWQVHENKNALCRGVADWPSRPCTEPDRWYWQPEHPHDLEGQWQRLKLDHKLIVYISLFRSFYLFN